MAIVAISHAKPVTGIRTPTMRGTEGASESWNPGAILLLDNTNGRIIEAASDDPVSLIAGVALNPATGTTGAEVHFIPALSDILFEATFSDKAAGTHTSVQTDLYKEYALSGTGATWYIDQNDEAAPSVMLWSFVDPVGTVDARAEFYFLNSVTMFV
jgi:hypothetical protein